MTSVRATNPDHVDAHSWATRDCSARLSLKPSSSTGSAVDGAWWPRLTDPAIELAALIEAVGAQRAPVRQIALTMSEWAGVPRRIRLAGGRKIAVDWVQTGDEPLIRIIDTDDQQIDVFLVPVDTTPATADLALTVATRGQDPRIAAAGSHDPGPVCPPAEAAALPECPPSDVVGRRCVVLLPHGSSPTDRSPPSPIANQLIDERTDATEARQFRLTQIWARVSRRDR